MGYKKIALAAALVLLCLSGVAVAGKGSGKVYKVEKVFKGVNTDGGIYGRFRTKGSKYGEACMYSGYPIVVRKVTAKGKTRFAKGQANLAGSFGFDLPVGRYQLGSPRIKIKNAFQGKHTVICTRSRSKIYRIQLDADQNLRSTGSN